jgi:putative membrane protein
MRYFVRLLAQVLSILIIAYLFPGLIHITGFMSALAAAVLLGIVNTLVRPLLVLLTFPLTILTLGLFLLVLNGLMLWIVSWLVPGFGVSGFWGAVAASLLISIVSWLISKIAGA